MKHDIVTNVDIKKDEIAVGDYVLLDAGLRQVVVINAEFALLNPKTGILTTSFYDSVYSLMSTLGIYNVKKLEQVDSATFRVIGEIK